LTATIRTEPARFAVAVADKTVTVGTAVPVAAVKVGVYIWVAVGEGGSVGNALGTGKVGNGAKVTVPKLNNAVGVATVPSLGKTLGLGTTFEAFRDPHWGKLIRMEQRKQHIIRNKPGKSILPICPCSL